MNFRLGLFRNHLFKSASILAGLSGAGAVTGLVLDALILASFGVGAHTDALFAALTVPQLLNGIVFVQTPKILIPTFGGFFDRDEDSEAWVLLRNLMTTCGLILAAVTLAGVVLSQVIVPLEIPGLSRDTIAIAIWLSEILFALVLLQGLSSILQSALYAKHSYLVGGASKFVVNGVTIVVVLLGHSRFGIQSVAWGMVLGSVLQFGLLISALARHGFRYRWMLNPADPRIRSIMGSFSYPLAGHLLGETGPIVQNVLGSMLGSGSLTLVRYAARIVQAIAGILLGSVVQVTLPIMARHAAANDLGLQRKALLESVQLLGVIALPIGVWLVFMAEPLVVLFFQRGQFSATEAVMTAGIIRLMVPDLLLGRLVSVTQTLFYANSDLRTPFISTVIYATANAVFAIVLSRAFGVNGIGMAVSIAAVSNAVYMIIKLQKRFGPVGWPHMRGYALRLGGTTAMAGAAFALGGLLTITAVPLQVGRLLAVGVPSALGLAVFVVGAHAFGLFDTRAPIPVDAVRSAS